MNFRYCIAAIQIIILLTISVICKAQGKHYEGLKSFGISASSSIRSKGIGLNYEYFISSRAIAKGNLCYEKFFFDYSDYKTYKFSPSVLYNFYNYRFIYLNAKAGLLTGLERHQCEILNDRYDNIYFGEEIGLNTEFYLTNTVKLEFEASQLFVQKSRVMKYNTMVSVGILINI